MDCNFEISGPYKYGHDIHSSYNVYGRDGILASFYAYDEDLCAARNRADIFVAAMEAVANKTPI